MRRSVIGRGKALRTASLLTVFLFAGLGATPAGAAPNGNWWHETMGVEQAHDDGNTGEGVNIAVIDGSINPDLPVLQGTDLSIREPSFEGDGQVPATGSVLSFATSHGTNVVSQIIGNGANGGPSGIAPDATVRFYSVAPPNAEREEPFSSSAMPVIQAVADGADIISMSIAGEIDEVETQTIAWAINRGVVVVVGLGNNGTDLDFIAQTNGVIAVASVDSAGNIPSWTRGHDKITVLAPGDSILVQGNSNAGDWSQLSIANGNSYATPIVSGVLALVASKYPEATGNQLIQSLVQNADGNGSYNPERGYGFVNLAGMLENDPTQYPDVNPLITEQPTFPGDLSAAEIAATTAPFGDPPDGWAAGVSPQMPTSAAATSDTDSDSDAGQGSPSAGNSNLLWVFLFVGLGLLVVVVVVVVLVLVLVKRRK